MNKKTLGLLGFVALLVALYLFTPARYYLSKEGFESLKLWIVGLGPLGPIVFIGLYVAATVFCLPGSVLTLTAGALFGTWLGTVYVIIAANLGANAAFLIARFLGQDIASKLLRGKFPKLDQGIEKGGFNWVFVLRLIPAVPFFAFNYAAGFTTVKWKDYLLGTLLGMLPGTFVYVSLGSAVSKVSLTDPAVFKNPQVWGPFLGIIVFTIVLKQIQKRMGVGQSSALSPETGTTVKRANGGK